MLLAVNQPPVSQLLDRSLRPDGCEYVVKRLSLGAVHLNFTAGDHGYLEGLRNVVPMFEASPFIVA